MERFDLVAIGGGTAGLVTAAGGAALGLRVALVERDALGGDCLWTGCVPSKALIASAKLAHQMRHAERLGLIGTSPAHLFESVMERMRAQRARVAQHDEPQRFRDMGVEVLFGQAEVIGRGRVAVDARHVESKRIVIATGASATVPPIPGLADTDYLTHETAFEQDSLPSHVTMLGGGPIGLEFSQVYRRLGAQVTVVEMLPQLLPREDLETAAVVRQALEHEGIVIHTATRVERVEAAPDGIVVVARDEGGREVRVPTKVVFVATGRRANTSGLGLETAGVELANGAIKTNMALRSTVPDIWAAGDVAGGPQFTHVAEYQAKLVLRNALFPFTSKVDYSAVPAVTYTDPEVARVGLTEAEARDRSDRVQAYRYEFSDLDRAIVDGHDTGFVKVVTKPNGRILGATVVGTGAGELLMPLVLAMKRRMKLPQLSQVIYPYPTMAEGIKRTADSYYRAKFAGRTGDWLRRVVRWLK
jgi:pyruvate/2-oxoglutarate dehydrogenase complex dihydrolipoamide dehydrogenase (E3) component